MGWGRTCQFSPASLASACSRSFSRVLTLLHGGWWLVSRAVYGTRGTWDKGQVWRPKQDSPIELSHTSLVLPLCSLENKVQVLILLLELLDRLDGWTVPELCLEIEDGRLELCEGGCLIRGQRGREGSSHYLVVLAILLEELFTKGVLCGFFALAKDTKFVRTECGRGPSVCPDALCAAHRGYARECVACLGVGARNT